MRWCEEISDKKGLAVIVAATEQGDFSIHNVLDPKDIEYPTAEPVYTGVGVKGA